MKSSDPVRLWTNRYRLAMQPAIIRERADIRGNPVKGLAAEDAAVAARQLDHAFERVFLTTDQGYELLIAELGRALAHALRVYPDRQAALRYAYQDVGYIEWCSPTFVTGPAGVGKSELRKALERVLAGVTEVFVDDEHPALPLIDHATATAGSNSTLRELICQLGGPGVRVPKSRMPGVALSRECRRWMYQCGTCLFSVDEFQNLSQTARAKAKITNALLSLGQLGVPWIFFANYDLGHKLDDAGGPVVQRLLERPRVLLPDLASSRDWAALLSEYQIVAQEVLEMELVEYRQDLWSLTAGLKRLLRRLIVGAYEMARAAGRQRMVWRDITATYNSMSFAAGRKEVETLIAGGGNPSRLPQILRCPFPALENGPAHADYTDALKHSREAKVASAMVEASMAPKEREAFRSLINETSNPIEQGPVRLAGKRPRRVTTFESLQQAAQQREQAAGASTRGRPTKRTSHRAEPG